ncbi:MAG: phenylalanine--tRNA ligase subunit alpha, partial [Ilumatobacteraceae bacterium]
MVSPDSPPASTIISDIESARHIALDAIATATDSEALRTLNSELNSKKSALTQLKSQLGKIADADARKTAGQLINDAMVTIAEAFGARLELLLKRDRAAQVAGEFIDLTECVTPDRRGHSHIVTQSTERLEDVFIGLGFHIAE